MCMCIEKNNCCWAIWQTPSWGIVMKTTTVEFISTAHFSFGQKWMLQFFRLYILCYITLARFNSFCSVKTLCPRDGKVMEIFVP